MAAPLRAGGERRQSLREAARIEAGLRAFLEDGSFNAFTDTFEDLHGLTQLPGIAVQRLMVAGYGFGAEGDWKTAVLVRAMKVMGAGLEGGTSFMETYTYDFGQPSKTTRMPFRHGAVYELPDRLPRLHCSYHPSQHNTQTGRLTRAMFRRVLRDVQKSLASSESAVMAETIDKYK